MRHLDRGQKRRLGDGTRKYGRVFRERVRDGMRGEWKRVNRNTRRFNVR